MHNTTDGFVAIAAAPGYWINQKGEIRGKKGKLLKPLKGFLGFKMVIFTISGEGQIRRKTGYIHRLLAEAFIPKPDEDKVYVVVHLNGISDDNRIENLAWKDKAEHFAESRAKAAKTIRNRIEARNNENQNKCRLLT